jgi:hypothetical protein
MEAHPAGSPVPFGAAVLIAANSPQLELEAAEVPGESEARVCEANDDLADIKPPLITVWTRGCWRRILRSY